MSSILQELEKEISKVTTGVEKSNVEGSRVGLGITQDLQRIASVGDSAHFCPQPLEGESSINMEEILDTE